MGFKDFQVGEVLTSQDVDNFLMRQSVMRFADASARDTAIGTALAEGMIAYLDDTDEVLKYDGSNWIDISGDISAVTAGTALTGGGTSGNVTLDVDTAAVGSAIGIDGKQDDVITTQGDLVIGDVNGDPSRIAIGTADTVLTSNGTTATWVAAGGGGGFDTIDEVTASNSSYDVSSISGFARITIIGAGGGGGTLDGGSPGPGGDGGNTVVVVSGTTYTAQGGDGGQNTSTPGLPKAANSSDNGGDGTAGQNTGDGTGGEIVIAYEDLTGVSTIDITIGAGGSRQASTAAEGFDGIVLLEYAS